MKKETDLMKTSEGEFVKIFKFLLKQVDLEEGVDYYYDTTTDLVSLESYSKYDWSVPIIVKNKADRSLMAVFNTEEELNAFEAGVHMEIFKEELINE